MTSIFLHMEAYIIRRTSTGKPRYQSRTILLSALCLPASFGMVNEAKQKLAVEKLAVDPVGSPSSLSSRMLEERPT